VSGDHSDAVLSRSTVAGDGLFHRVAQNKSQESGNGDRVVNRRKSVLIDEDPAMNADGPSELATMFGRRLRAWRKQQNYAIRAVADDLKVSKQVVSEWERGLRFPCQKHLTAIARYTRVPLCTFFRDGPCCCHPDAVGE